MVEWGGFLTVFFFFLPTNGYIWFFFFFLIGIRISMVFYYQNKAKEIGYRLIAIVPYLSLSSTTETKSKMMERQHAQLKYNKSPLNKVVDHYLGKKETYHHVLLHNKHKYLPQTALELMVHYILQRPKHCTSIECNTASPPQHHTRLQTKHLPKRVSNFPLSFP